jgi:hypothetical protein
LRKDGENIENNEIIKKEEKVNIKTSLSYFVIHSIWPTCFYFAYTHCGQILKNKFGLTAAEVIHQNLIVSTIHLISLITFTYLTYKIYPLKIFKSVLIIFSVLTLLSQYFSNYIQTPFQLLLVQILSTSLAPGAFLTAPIFFIHFPVFKRFTYSSFLYAISHSLIYIINSFGMVYLVEYFGNYGVLFLLAPVIIGSAFGVIHLENLEKKAGNYPSKSSSLLST